MADASLFVHKCARDAHEQITRLSDFISPTIVAMWNLRWQVQGFLGAYPNAKQEDIVQRFALGSGMSGREIQRACTEVSWEEQKSRFSSILLTSTVAIFEDFTETLAGLTLSGKAKGRVANNLQFPASSDGGYQHAYAELGNPIPELTGVFTPAARAGRWYSGPHLQNLLRCFRFFKEIRNALAHNGGRVDQKLMDKYAEFASVAAPSQLGMKFVPNHTTPVLGSAVVLDLQGIRGFSDVILRLIATYDADLSDRAGALADIKSSLPSISGPDRTHLLDKSKRDRRISGLLRGSRLPHAVLTAEFLAFLRQTNRIPNYW
jgi:hypothetical protein